MVNLALANFGSAIKIVDPWNGMELKNKEANKLKMSVSAKQPKPAAKSVHSKRRAERPRSPNNPALIAENADYLSETRRPFVSLIFVLPILLTYELGAILLGNASIRSGLDVWTSSFLAFIGIGELFLLPFLTAVILMLMHHIRDDRFGFHPSVITGMVIESFALALIVFCGAKAQLLFWTESAPAIQLPMAIGSGEPTTIEDQPQFSFWNSLVAFCGAGLYEELVFRLMLIPAVMVGFMKLGWKQVPAAVVAILISSLLFASVHYQIVNPTGLPWDWAGFMAKFIASIFFSLVFLFRGFGIAVGTHVAYDLLTLL